MNMITSKTKQLVFSLITASALSLSVAMPVYAADSVELTSKAEVDVVVKHQDGTKETKRVIAKKIAPDGEVIYTTTFKNIIAKPVANILINNPIPKDMRYTIGSASGVNTDITFSVDGGKTFAKEDKLIVTTKEGNTRPAAADDYTNIRWVYQGELAAGQSSSVQFKAVVK
ncbi:MAG: hypothetical protein WBP13_03690 [Methylophilaceae bacterium]